MQNIEQSTALLTSPQLKPDLDMTSHLAATPASQAGDCDEHDRDEDGPKIRVVMLPVGWP